MPPSENTIKQYEYCLKKYNTLDYNNPKKVWETLSNVKNNEKNLSPTYIKMILCAIIWKLRQNKDPPEDILNKYRKRIAELRTQQDIKERNHQSYAGFIPEWDDIIKKRAEQLKNKKYLNHLILSLYTYIPPRRLKDFILMKIATNVKSMNDIDYNYYDANNQKFIFNAYKTAKTYKQQIINIPDELNDIILVYIERYKLNNGDFLLGFHDYKQIYYRLKKLLGCAIDNIRHSYVNHVYNEGGYKLPSSEFMEKLSNDMAHSLETNLRYRKYPKK